MITVIFKIGYHSCRVAAGNQVRLNQKHQAIAALPSLGKNFYAARRCHKHKSET